MEGLSQTRVLTRMALLVAVATILHAVERGFLGSFLWIRLGLANAITLLSLVLLGLKEALTVTFLRCLLGSLLNGSLFTPSFVLGLGGTTVATLVMGLFFFKHSLGFSLIGISIVGAVANNLVQLLIATFLIIKHIGTLIYLPFLMIMALLGGSLNGLLVAFLIRYLPLEVIQ